MWKSNVSTITLVISNKVDREFVVNFLSTAELNSSDIGLHTVAARHWRKALSWSVEASSLNPVGLLRTRIQFYRLRNGKRPMA